MPTSTATIAIRKRTGTYESCHARPVMSLPQGGSAGIVTPAFPRRRRAGPGGGPLAAQAVAVVGLADDADHLVGVVDPADQGDLGRADVGLRQHPALPPPPHPRPVLP